MTDQPQTCGPPPPSRTWRRAWLISTALCVIAAAAVLITMSGVSGGWRIGASGPARAPKLAALSNQQLADLLPNQHAFPAGWMVKHTTDFMDVFGYYRSHMTGVSLDFKPDECFEVIGVGLTGAFKTAEVSGHDPANPVKNSDREDIRVMVGREFNTAGFDEMIAQVSRCLNFTASSERYALRIIEDSRPAADVQRFRYVLARSAGARSALATGTEYFSYARTPGLILSGSGDAGHRQSFDALFDNTLRRIRDA